MGFLTIIQHMTLVQLQQQATATYTATIYLAILPLNLKQHKHEQAPRKGERDHGRGGGVEEKCRNPQNESRGSKSRRSGGLQKATQSPTGRSTAPEAHFSLQLYHHGHWGPPYRWRHRILHLIRQEKTRSHRRRRCQGGCGSRQT
jgi:hypothetical protein